MKLTRLAKVTVKLPDGIRAYYLNLIDDRGPIVSTKHEELKSAGVAGSQPGRTPPCPGRLDAEPWNLRWT
jgi:hypothetical protein